ncbi:MAG: hypothetical protein WBI14_00945 [Anaerolineaceae bacterium]
MEIGSIVRFKEGLYADEEGALYRVIEDNGDRVFIKFICDLNFPPVSVARTTDLEVVEAPHG